MVWSTRVIVVVLMCSGCSGPVADSSAKPAFGALVDEYLDQFARRHPSIAAGNGLHAHDDGLEDFSASAIASEIDWLRSFRTRLDAVNPAALSPDERGRQRILQRVGDGGGRCPRSAAGSD